MSNWLADRLSPAKLKEPRWVELSTILEHIWEEFFDPDMSRVERLRSSYTADKADLAQKIREMGDYFSFDMPRQENLPISLGWRRLELEYKDMELIITSIFRRHFNNLPVHWLPLYASLESPYGSQFKIAPEFAPVTKNIPPDGMFLTSRGMLGADYGYLMTMGLSKAFFLERALPLIRRAKPLHIVFDGMLWFISFDLPFDVEADNGAIFWERDWGLVELQFSVYGCRFDYTPADIRQLDAQSMSCGLEISNSSHIPFWPDFQYWHLDKHIAAAFSRFHLPLDAIITGNEADNNPCGLIIQSDVASQIKFHAPNLKIFMPESGALAENLEPSHIMEALMAEDMPKIWQQAKLLNRYYEKVGRAAAGMGCCPQFVEFAAGYGLVEDEDSSNPALLPIPPDIAEIPNAFYRAPVEAAYNDGSTICKCEIPQTAVGKPTRHNLIGVFDQDNDLVAVCQTLPDWVTPSEIYRAFPAITFPIEKDNDNE